MTGTTDAINEAEARTLVQRVWVRLEGVVERAVDTIKKLQDFVAKMNTPEAGTTVAPAPSIGTDNSVSGKDSATVNNNTIKIALGRETVAVVLLLSIVIGICGAVMGLNLSKQDRQDESYRDLKTQYWLLERRLMDNEALQILHGQKLPSDTEWGPTGNMERMKPKDKKSSPP